MNNPTIDDYIITVPTDAPMSVRQLLVCVIPPEQPTHSPACCDGKGIVGFGKELYATMSRVHGPTPSGNFSYDG